MSIPEDFKSIGNDSSLREFLRTHQFQEIPAAPKWNLGEFELVQPETTFRVGYRCHDPSQAFSIQKDIHKAELWSVDKTGRETVLGNVAFPEDA